MTILYVDNIGPLKRIESDGTLTTLTQADLTGPTGPTGPQGSTGTQGPTGAAGSRDASRYIEDYGGGIGMTGAQNVTAFNAMQSAMGLTGARWQMMEGKYQFASQLLVTKPMHIRGVQGGSWRPGTWMEFAPGTKGIIINHEEVTGDLQADGSSIEQVYLRATGKQSASTGTLTNGSNVITAVTNIANISVGDQLTPSFVAGVSNTDQPYMSPTTTGGRVTVTAKGASTLTMSENAFVPVGSPKANVRLLKDHGITLYGRATIRNVFIDGFAGDGIAVIANHATGLNSTNANGWRIDTARIINSGGNGLFVDGSDSNAGCGTAIDTDSNDGFGIWDSSFLGNTYMAPEVADDTLGAFKTDGSVNFSVFYGIYIEGAGAVLVNLPSMIFGGPSASNNGSGVFLSTDGSGLLQLNTNVGGSGYSGKSKADASGEVVTTHMPYSLTNRASAFHAASSYDDLELYASALAQRWRWQGADGISPLEFGTILSPEAQSIARFQNGYYSNGRRRGVGLDTTTGQALTGDISYDAAPAAGGKLGSVCITAGRNHLASTGTTTNASPTVTAVTNPTTWRASKSVGVSVGDVLIDSNKLKNVTNLAAWAVGDNISATGIPAGTSVIAKGGTTIWMDKVATSTGAGRTLLSPGDVIKGTGIPANTTVNTVVSTTITLSANATASNAGVALFDSQWKLFGAIDA